MRQLIDNEVDKLSESQIIDADEKTAAFVRATNKYAKMINIIITTLKLLLFINLLFFIYI